MAKKKNVVLKINLVKRAEKITPTSLPKEYAFILEAITNRIRNAQTRAMLAVNRELIDIYRDIGKTIYEQQQTATWGASVVEQLAHD